MNAMLNPSTGSLVYNTTEESIYQRTDTGWVALKGWGLTGNTGTNSATNFIGTTDAQNLVFKTNDTEAITILQNNQFIGFNDPNPTSPLHITRDIPDGIGIMRVEGTEPDVNFNDTDGGFNTFTFENNGSPRFAFGRRDTDAFYITRNDGIWHDETFNILNTNGFIGINTDAPEANLEIESGDNIPFKIEPKTTAGAPTGTPTAGAMFIADDGLLYLYDGTRTKWLSVDRIMLGWGRNSNNTTNEYLRQFNGAPSNNNGWRIIRNGTITAISAQSNINQDWTLEIYKNDANQATTTPITSLTMTNEQGNHLSNINIDINEGDFIQAYCNGASVDYPQALIEIAWRK